jgi:hypothetical protein
MAKCKRCGKEITRYPFLKVAKENERLCDSCIEEDMWKNEDYF